MKPKIITGSETLQQPNQALEKLIEFYRAFNHGDMNLMQQNWEHSSEASMSNPLGGIKRGWDEIAQVYERIFNGPARVYVEYYDYSLHQGEQMFTVVGREQGYFKLADTQLELAIRTSRTYRQTVDGWRQLHHHGSIDNPALLEKYQSAVLRSS